MIQRHCLITIFIYNGPVKYFNKNTRILAWYQSSIHFFKKNRAKYFYLIYLGGKYFFRVYLFKYFLIWMLFIFCGKHLFDYPGSLF